LSRAAVAILAAGRGERLGGDVPKPLLQLRGRALVSWALAAATATELRPVVLVVGHASGEVAREATEGVVVVRAHRWSRGIARSLRAALGVVEPYRQVTALCVGLADQPLVGSGAYSRLAAAHADGAELAVATYGGVRGNPVLLGRSLWAEANALDSDTGARALMGAHDVTEVDCTGTGDPRDVDTIDDLRAMEASMEG
jgi:molybdenum cofactor cytidylyltransferase/nicotine blue oxidoreductase